MQCTKRLTSLLIAISMIFTVAMNVSFAQGKTDDVKYEKTVSLGKVQLRSGVTVEISNLMLLPTGNNQTVSFTASYRNDSNTQLDLFDYWINLYTKSGSKLSLQMDDSKASSVPSKSSKDVVYISTVASNVKITDLVIKVIEWDFSISSYTKVIGEITVPQRYTAVTPAQVGRIVNQGDQSVSFYIKQSTIGKSDQYYRPNLTITIRNESKSTIELPDYQMYILTQNNLLYPLTATGIKGTALNPLTDKEFKLTTSIPIAIEQGNWKLLIATPINEGKNKIAIAEFELPKSNVETGNDLNKYYTFTNADGVYNVKLNSMNRLPIEDDDLIVANLTITNNGTESLPYPDLSGKYVFNNSIEKNVTVTNNNKVIAIPPKGSIDLQMVGRVPYTFDIANVKLVVQQKDSSDNTVEDLLSFVYDGNFHAIPSVQWNEGFKITDVGYRSEVKIRNIMTYEGMGADIIAVQLTVTNEEKRQAQMQELAGFFEKKDGTVFPVMVQTISDKLNPGGNALIYMWATVPKGTGFEDVGLVIGKAIVDNPTTPGSSTPSTPVLTGYATPYSFVLPEEKEAQDGLQNIDIYPYSLSINRVRTHMDFVANSVRLDFEYTLEQDLLTKVDMKEHKIIIELQDDNEGVTFSRDLKITDSLSGSADDPGLTVGSKKLELPAWINSDMMYKMQKIKEFQFNVYYEITPGYKKLIATEKIPWLVDRKLN